MYALRREISEKNKGSGKAYKYLYIVKENKK